MSKNKPKILLFDIENAPNLGWVWGKWEQNVLDFERQQYHLCFAYKWLGEKKTKIVSQRDFSVYKKDRENDKGVILKLWELFDEADIIIAHNGDSFDIKMSNARFLAHGLSAPSSYKTIDTKKVARKYFRLNSNSLNDIGKTFNLGQKLQHTGFELWQGCMKGEKKSWKLMEEYCKQDVVLLEQVYLHMRPWMDNHPNSNLHTGGTHDCPVCASKNTQRRGFSVTRVGKYQRYQCMDCSAWSTGEVIKREKGDKIVLR